MDYGEIISRSVRIVVRHPYLWLLGLPAGEGGAATLGNGGRSGAGARTGGPDGAVAWTWLSGHLGLVLGVGFALALLAVALFVLRCIAAGAVIRAADAHASGRASSLREAWSAGTATAWRVMGLKLFSLLLAACAAVVSLGTIAIAVLLASEGRPAFAIPTGVVGGLLLLAAVAFWVTLGVATALGLRAAVLDGLPAIDALRRGFSLIRRRFGRTAVLWVLLLVLSWLAGVAVALVAVVVGLPFAGLGAAAWFAAGMGPLFVSVVAIGVAVLLAAVLACAGFVGAFASTYWTLAYRRLDPEPGPAALPRAA